MITDPDDPRLDDRLGRFARRHADRADGGAAPRGSELLDGVFFSSDSARRRSSARAASTSTASTTPSCTTSPTRSGTASTRSRCSRSTTSRGDPAVDAIELEVPGVTADALRDGLLADQEAAERLFGGSVTLDGHLILSPTSPTPSSPARSPSRSAATSAARSPAAATASSSRPPRRPPRSRCATQAVRHRRRGGRQIGLQRVPGALTVDLDGDGEVDFATSPPRVRPRHRRRRRRPGPAHVYVLEARPGLRRLGRARPRPRRRRRPRRRSTGSSASTSPRPAGRPRGRRRPLVHDAAGADGAVGRTRLAGTPGRDFVDLSRSPAAGLRDRPAVFVQIDDAGRR